MKSIGLAIILLMIPCLAACAQPQISPVSVAVVEDHQLPADWRRVADQASYRHVYRFEFELLRPPQQLQTWRDHQYQLRVFSCLGDGEEILLPAILGKSEIGDFSEFENRFEALLTDRILRERNISSRSDDGPDTSAGFGGVCFLIEGRNDFGLPFRSNYVSFEDTDE